jgi:hypothetical protein
VSPGGWARLRALRWIPLLVLLNVLLAGANVLVWGPGWRLLESQARFQAEKALGRARVLDVHLWSTSVYGLLVGRINLLRMDGEGLRLKNGLTVASMHVVVQGLEVRPSSLRRIDSVRYQVTVTEKSLNRFLARKARGTLAPVPVVHLTPGEMEVTGKQLGFAIPVQIRGGLSVADGSRVRFDLHGAAARSLIVAGVMALLNPVVDLRDPEMQPLGISIDRLQVLDGALEVAGHANPAMPFVIPPQSPPLDDDDCDLDEDSVR